MSKRISVVFCLLLVVAMAFSVVGCSQPADNSGASGDGAASGEQVNLEFWDMAWGPAETYPVAAETIIERYTTEVAPNVSVNYTNLPWSNWFETFSTAVASNSAPDFSTGGGFMPFQFAVTGEAADLQWIVDEWKKEGTDTDFPEGALEYWTYKGKQIGIPWNFDPRITVIRQDWLDKVNMKAPTTVDEFIAVMKAFKDQNVNGSGDVLPFCSSSGYIPAMVNFFGAHEGFYLDKDSDTIKYGPVEDNWKEAMNFIYRIYQEGLLDKEFPTNDTTIFEQKVSANRVGMFYGWPFSGLVRCNELIKAVDANAQYVPIAPIKKDASSVAVKEGKQATLIARSAITSSNKYPVETIKLINYLYSRDGEILMNWGIEGEDYTIVDGKPQFMDSIMKNSDGPSVARGKRGMQRAFPFLADKEAEMAVADELVVKAWTEYNESGALWPLMPNVSIPEDKQARFNSLNTQISTYLQEKRAAFMIGTESIDKEYDGFKKELENRGLSEILAIYNDAYTAYKANIK